MTIDYKSLAKAQLKDKELLNFLESNHSLKIKSVQVTDTSFTLLCDESISGKLRPQVPSGHYRTTFNSIHNLSHSSIGLRNVFIAFLYFLLLYNDFLLLGKMYIPYILAYKTTVSKLYGFSAYKATVR